MTTDRHVSSAGGVRRRRGGDEAKRVILEAAMALYAHGGVRGTGLAAIGQAVGVTHSAVLYHFGSVQNLLQAVIDERDRRFWRETADTWRGREGLDVLRALPKLAEWNTANRGLNKLFVTLQTENLAPDAEAHQFFLDRHRRVRRRIRRAVETGQRQGTIRRDVDPQGKADEVVSFMEGAAITALLDPATDMVVLFESYTAMLVASLAVDRAGRSVPRPRARAAGPRVAARGRAGRTA